MKIDFTTILQLEPTTNRGVIKVTLACSLAIASDLNGALDLLDQYFDRVVSAANIRHAEIDPDMYPLREEPRFKAMVAGAKRRLGIVEQGASQAILAQPAANA